MRKLSHTFVVAGLIVLLGAISKAQGPGGPPRDMTIDAKTRVEVINGAVKQLQEAYVFPEVAKKMAEAIQDRIARKEYDGITSATALVRTLTDNLQQVSHDKHLRVTYSGEPIPDRGDSAPSPSDLEHRRGIAALMNFGFQKVERLDGNIGYLDLRGFMNPGFAAATCAAAMSFLANTDALIIDLRNNGGGQPEMVALLSSYLFDKPTHLNDIYWRPTNKTTEFWTKEKVDGARYGMKDVYVLTSRRTFSGAEEFAYNLQKLKRAAIVGETTGGGAHPVDFRRINEHFGIRVPAGRAINPITKTNWEGTGVKPDVDVPAAQALKTAQLMALKKVAESNTDPMRATGLKASIAIAEAELSELKSSKPSAVSSGNSDLPVMPDTPAARIFAAFVVALNSGSLENMRRFHQERAGNVDNAGLDFDFFTNSGGLKVHSVTRSEPTEIEALAQRKKDGSWITFTMSVDPNPPHAAMRIGMQPASPPK